MEVEAEVEAEVEVEVVDVVVAVVVVVVVVALVLVLVVGGRVWTGNWRGMGVRIMKDEDDEQHRSLNPPSRAEKGTF